MLYKQVGDPQEVNALSDVLCKNRNNPLLIGSVKSNMGHSEPASGLCSLVKVIISNYALFISLIHVYENILTK